jgi:hypothetical protein
MNKICKQLTAIAILLLMLSPAFAGDHQAAFAPGEILRYKLRWGLIPAGEAELKVMPVETIDGVQVFHFVMKARTNAFADAFYRLRSRIDAYADLEMTRSIKYVKKTEVRNKHKIDTVDFNWQQSHARYHRREVLNGPPVEIKNQDQTTPLMDGTFDPLSAFYYTRTIRLNGQTNVARPVSDGKKCVMANARILGRERIKINGNKYDTLLISPDLRDVKGVFQKSKNAKIRIWVSADRYQIPLRIQSKVIVGSFTGDLIDVQRSVDNTTIARQQTDSPAN